MNHVARHIIVFGEVLFDVFPDQRAILGGAPFNVAWHLHSLGASPLFVSRIGSDPYGQQIIQAMHRQRMRTEAMQQDDHFPTGTVQVQLTEGIPSYEIACPSAYDAIEPLPPSLTPPQAVLYHGTLSLRQSTSSHSLQLIQRQHAFPAFVDINLRPPHYNDELLRFCLEHATWLKLNLDELIEVGRRLLPRQRFSQPSDANGLFEHFGLEHILLTCGADGAHWFSRQGKSCFQPVTTVDQMVDTVGAGDAFSAVALMGILEQWPADVLMERAAAFAAAICQIRGAIPVDDSLYTETLNRWNATGGAP